MTPKTTAAEAACSRCRGRIFGDCIGSDCPQFVLTATTVERDSDADEREAEYQAIVLAQADAKPRSGPWRGPVSHNAKDDAGEKAA